MKKVTLCLIVGACALSCTAFADNVVQADNAVNQVQQKPKKFEIEWNILPTLFGYVSGTVSYVINPAGAVGLTAGTSTGSNDSDIYNVGVQYSYALNGDYMSTGWIVKPFISYASSDSEEGYGVGSLITYKWHWDSGVNLQLGIGPTYYSVNTSYWGDDDDDSAKGLSLAGEFGFGFTF